MAHIFVAIFLAIIAAVAAYFGHRAKGRAGAYGLYVEASKPSELADGVPGFYGGTVALPQGQQALLTPYGKKQCVVYNCVVEQRTTERDADGTEREEWQTVSQSGQQGMTFALQNGDAYVFVNPVNAEVSHEQNEQTFPEPGQVEGLGKVGTVLTALNKMGGPSTRVTETYIPVGGSYFVGGTSTAQNSIRTFANDSHYPLVLTTMSKQQLVKDESKSGLIGYSVAAVLVAGAIAAFTLIKN